MLDKEKQSSERIILASLELFQRYGIRSVSMADIAQHLSISKKTLYQYFADKDSLVCASVGRILDQDKPLLCCIREESEDVLVELVKLSIYVRKRFRSMNPAMLLDLKKYHPKGWEIFVQFKESFIKSQIVDTIQKGIAVGVFRADIDVEIAARLRLQLIELAFDTQVYPPSTFELVHVQEEFFNFFVYGLLTAEGHKTYVQYLKNQDSNA